MCCTSAPTTAGARRNLDIDATAGEQTNGGIVDFRSQHLLGAAGKEDDAFAPLELGDGGARPGKGGTAQEAGGRQLQHRHQLAQPQPAQHAREGLGKSRRA